MENTQNLHLLNVRNYRLLSLLTQKYLALLFFLVYINNRYRLMPTTSLTNIICTASMVNTYHSPTRREIWEYQSGVTYPGFRKYLHLKTFAYRSLNMIRRSIPPDAPVHLKNRLYTSHIPLSCGDLDTLKTWYKGKPQDMY